MIDEYGVEQISPYFYSNCFIQALKAKIKNPRMKILKIPIHGTWVPHFEWTDGVYYYDFGVNNRISTPLLFKGCLRRNLCEKENQG